MRPSLAQAKPAPPPLAPPPHRQSFCCQKSDTVQRLVLAMGYDQLHQVEVLAKSREWLFNSAEEYGLFGSTGNLTTNKDSNITLWGHAGQYSYGGKTPEELVQELIEMGLEKSKHTTLEILGCAPNQTNDKSEETYVQRVQQLLDSKIERKIQTYSYPMPVPQEKSVDYRFDQANKFAYVYGPGDKLEAADKQLVLLNKIYLQSQGQDYVYEKFLKYLKKEGISYKAGAYRDVRKHLEKPHTVKTYKGEKSDLTELFLKDVYN